MRKLSCLLVLGVFAMGCLAPESTDVDADQRPHTAKAAEGASTAPGDEVMVAVDQLPEIVMTHALRKLPGFVVQRAERQIENGVTVYDLEGTANGKSYEMEVTADGRVLEFEEEDDDDDDEDDDDEDDDDSDDDDGDAT